MSGDLISREALIKKIFPYGMPDGGNYGINARAVMEAITRAEAVEVVRCKDCDHYDNDGEYCGFWGGCRHPEHFCDEGERRTDNA